MVVRPLATGLACFNKAADKIKLDVEAAGWVVYSVHVGLVPSKPEICQVLVCCKKDGYQKQRACFVEWCKDGTPSDTWIKRASAAVVHSIHHAIAKKGERYRDLSIPQNVDGSVIQDRV